MLLELVVSVGFMAVLGSLVLNMLSQGWELNSRNSALLDVAVDVSASTTWLVRDIHTATDTNLPDGGGAQASGQFSWTDTGGAHTCDYTLVAGDIVRTCDSTATVIASNASNFQFIRVGDLITVSYDIASPDRPDISDSIALNVALGAG